MPGATVSVLFTDLVGSTQLLSRVGAERGEELRREHFGALRTPLVDGGREVKNLGDGLMVVFESVTAALAAAVAMQQAIELRNRDSDVELSVRIGLSTGEADVDEDDYFGTPVVEAARLCARAEGGEILVHEVVRMLVGSRGGFHFEPVGELELKGLESPVPTSRLSWSPLSPADQIDIPIQPRLVATADATFVGRRHELERLDAAHKRAQAGQPQIVLLGGEPGVGKSALAGAFARQPDLADTVVLYGRCDEDLGIPYQPWAEALGHLVRHLPTPALEAHVHARGGELTPLVPGLAARVDVPAARSGDGEAERYLLFGAVVDLLERVSAERPVVLILDDLHWADRPSLQLLRHVVGSDFALRLLVIGTFRDSEVGADHPLGDTLAAVHREANGERLTLRGLDDVELLEMMEATAGHLVGEEGVALRDALLQETEGNPFFVGEILRHLAETGAIFRDEDGRWTTSGELGASALPVSVREVIMRRVGRLGNDTRRVLSMASVIGRDFDIELLARVVEVDDDRLVDLLDRATQAAVIAETGAPGQFTFAHALVEHTLYEEQSALRRARAHQLLGEALEDLCRNRPDDRVGELAHHWALATQPQDLSKAIEYAQLAGDRALASQAPDDAARWYEQALDQLDRNIDDEPRRRASLLVSLGEAQRQMGDPTHRETLIAAADLADHLDDVALLTRAAIANNRGWSSRTGVADEGRIRVLRRALDRLGEVDTADRARLLATLCAELLFAADFEDRLALAETAIAVARLVGDEITLLDTLVRTHESIVAPATLAQRLAWSEEACQLAEAVDDPLLRGMAYTWRHLAAVDAGDPVWARQGLEVATAVADHIGQPTYRWVAAVQASMAQAIAGDVAGAEETAMAALALGMEAGQADAVGAFGMQLLTLRWMQGRLGEMVPLLEQTLEDMSGVAAVRAGLAMGLAEGGRLAEARQLLDEEAAKDFERGIGSGWLTGHAMWALVACATDHVEAGQVLFDRLAPWHEQFISSHLTAYGPVAHPLGALARLLGRDDEAARCFAEAQVINTRMRASFFSAFTGVAWAEMLADTGGPDDLVRARAMADDALAGAIEGGYGGVEQAARALVERLT